MKKPLPELNSDVHHNLITLNTPLRRGVFFLKKVLTSNGRRRPREALDVKQKNKKSFFIFFGIKGLTFSEFVVF
jgi:hypothetical protein